MDGRRYCFGTSGCGNNSVVLHMEALKEERKMKLKTRKMIYKILNAMDIITALVGLILCFFVYPLLLVFSCEGQNKALVLASLVCGAIGSAMFFISGSLNDDVDFKITALVVLGFTIGLSVLFLFV